MRCDICPSFMYLCSYDFTLYRVLKAMKGFLSYSFLLVLFLTVGAGKADAQIHWLTWEEAQKRNVKEPRKFLVDVYTQWCGWCKKMDKTTFSNAEISAYINDHYYPIKFDAETKEPIHYKNREYKYMRGATNSYHELAAEITLGKLSYPTLVFLDERLNVIQPLPGYKDVTAMDKIIKYFAEDYFKSMPWKKYEGIYQQQLVQPSNPANRP